MLCSRQEGLSIDVRERIWVSGEGGTTDEFCDFRGSLGEGGEPEPAVTGFWGDWSLDDGSWETILG